MKYRRFGRTELQIPVISCGGMRYQYKWQDVAPEERPRRQPAQSRSHAFTGRWILGSTTSRPPADTAHPKCSLGAVLPTLPRDRIIVQTKVAPHESPDEFLRTFDLSMKHLRLDRVDLLALHGINNRQLLDWSLQKNGCLAAARRLQHDGRVGFVGFSTHATTDLILEAVGSGEFDYVNLHWYIRE